MKLEIGKFNLHQSRRRNKVKIIQIQAMPDNEHWQGNIIGLGDDGVTYVSEHDQNGSRWVKYIENTIIESNKDKAIELMGNYIDWVINVDEEEWLSESNCKGHEIVDEINKLLPQK